MNGWATGLALAACSSAASDSALTCSSRDRPEPFSSTSSGMAMPLLARNARITPADCSGVAGGLPSIAPSDRNRLRAMVLLLFLLMS